MIKKSGSYYADWRDSTGRRHRAAFPTAAEAQSQILTAGNNARAG
jgi:hypothetical protein